MVICLERGADLHTAQLMPLPLAVSCFGKIQIGSTSLVPAHPGSPGKGRSDGFSCGGADCEYGDKAAWCATIGVTADRCTPSDLGDQCCQTCSELVPGGVEPAPPPGAPAPPQTSADCPHGDQASYCPTIDNFNCYNAAQQCCISCAKYKTDIPGTCRLALT